MAESENRSLLGRLAVHYGLISMDQLAEATREQGRRGGGTSLGQILLDLGFLQPSQLQQLVIVQKEALARRSAAHTAPPAAATRAASEPPAQQAAPAPVGSAGALDRLLRDAVRAGASDVHVHAGARLRLRLHGRLIEVGESVVEAPEAERLVRGLLSAQDAALLDAHGEVDLCHTLRGVGRFRVNAYRQQRGLDAVLRVIPLDPPSLEHLGLPQSLARFTNHHQGMVLVTGPAGCGKSATLAALVHLINEERREHVITIEDPIEYVHVSKRCLVNQRNVRRHTESFARALRAALREDPDVIVIGELRDQETISLALTAAETGHLVLATLHTRDTVRTINRIVGAYAPEQQDQVRTMLSESLRAVVSQRLLPRATGEGRVAALEVLVVTRAVGNLIRENKTFQIRSLLQTGAAQGMELLEQSLARLVQQGVVTREEAARHADDPKRLGGGSVAEAR